MSTQDNLNCLKNLMQLMCYDGAIHSREKAFLKKAADQLDVAVEDWNGLLKEILRDKVDIYPVSHPEKAVAALKAFAVMAKHDGHVDEKEKRFVIQFAKSIGISRSQWKDLLENIDAENLFEPFQQPAGEVIALSDDFEKLQAFMKVAAENGASVDTIDLNSFIKTDTSPKTIVCFHAAPEKDTTVARCRMLLDKVPDRLVCILTRFQGHQVKYLHEAGLQKCVIEPVYARDITEILKLV